MKTKQLLAAICAAVAATGLFSSCIGMTESLGTGYYSGYDDLWYNGFGYVNNYYVGYYCPNYGYGP